MGFPLVSTFAKRLFIDANLGEKSTGLSRFLSRHSAVLVEIDSLVGHTHTSLGARLEFQRKIASKAEVSAASCDRSEIPESTKWSSLLRLISHRHTVLPLGSTQILARCTKRSTCLRKNSMRSIFSETGSSDLCSQTIR